MAMYSFQNDYSEGAHPDILAALQRCNLEQNIGYGLDDHSLRAAELIKARFGCADADVHFLMGGTQVNQTAIAAFLRPHQAVISAADGHIYVHEAGAIEATGHKILPVSSPDAKLTPTGIEAVLAEHGGDEHMVQPRLVYLSNATDMGAAYTLGELEAIAACCRQNSLLLYLDGARLGQALMADGVGMQPEDIARLCDAFYIGGTKNGMLLGEALVIVNDALKADFRYLIKQRGAMMAKGFVVGLQFEAAFAGTLYFDLAAHANAMAARLAEGIENHGGRLLLPQQTNMIYPVLPLTAIAELEKKFRFYVRGFRDGKTASLRMVTSWVTSKEKIDTFLERLEQLM